MKETTEYLYQRIPLSKALGVVVSSFDSRGVVLSVPLLPNLNHKQTAFGGSLISAAVLSAWTYIYVKSGEEGINEEIVIQNSSYNFLSPVDDNFTAFTTSPSDRDWESFKKTLKRRGKARLVLTTEVFCKDLLCGIHTGSYVGIAKVE